MKNDVNGCSTCPAGGEQYEEYNTPRGKRVQYDYRAPDNTLFTCTAKSLEEARAKRDKWVEARQNG